MKIKTVLVGLSIALSSIHAQIVDKKSIIPPPFDPKSTMSSKVKDFVESCKIDSIYVKQLKKDVLGRNSADSVSYIAADTKKMKVNISYINTENSYTVSFSGRYEVDSLGQKSYWINDQSLSENEYFRRFNYKKQQLQSSVQRSRPSETRYLSAKEILQLMDGPDLVSISEYMEPVPQSNDTIISGTVYYKDSIIRTQAEIENMAFPNGHKGAGVGIYFTETGCPNLSYINTALYSQGSSCLRGVRTHPTGVTRILQTTAPQATVYGFDQVNYPDNPMDYPVPLYIGSHSWGFNNDSIYEEEDRKMDNYVYENWVIEFVAAGNVVSSSRYVITPGKALNAITVGAIKPDTYTYASYSLWKNPALHHQKPEIANFTHFYFPTDAPFSVTEDGVTRTYNGTFNGTSAATPFSAAMAADVLSQHPFYKEQPAVFKALMMVGSTKNINGSYTSGDMDNYSIIKKIPQYSKMTQNTRTRYWIGGNNSYFNGDFITFTESGITEGARYRIAISWLSSGNYVIDNRIIPQDIDLYVYQNGALIATANSYDNPFELVDFTTTSSNDLTIEIQRNQNSGSDNIILGYAFTKVN